MCHAWMLEGATAGLPEDDDRRPALTASAAAHRVSGLTSVPGACPSDAP